MRISSHMRCRGSATIRCPPQWNRSSLSAIHNPRTRPNDPGIGRVNARYRPFTFSGNSTTSFWSGYMIVPCRSNVRKSRVLIRAVVIPKRLAAT